MTDSLKVQAAVAALEEVESGMAVGLGTGSTVSHFITGLGKRVRDGLEVTAIATSLASERLAKAVGIRLVTFREIEALDVTVDGADEVSPELSLVKGLGGALVREKLVAQASARFVVVVDDSKLVDALGTRAPIPVEVVPFAVDLVTLRLAAVGGEPRLRSVDGAVFVSDNGNHVIDWYYGPVSDPASLERDLKLICGVVDSGIFSNLADRVISAGERGIRSFERPK
jgi:ribose 5-phosphate isomerase A